VEAVHELEAEGDEEGDSEQNEREDRARMDVGEIAQEIRRLGRAIPRRVVS
jgi:hypothetical protein